MLLSLCLLLPVSQSFPAPNPANPDREVFSQIDTDGDGFVTKTEMEDFLEENPEATRPENLEEMFQDDAKLTYEELADAIPLPEDDGLNPHFLFCASPLVFFVGAACVG